MNTGTHRVVGVGLAVAWGAYAPWSSWPWVAAGIFAGANAPDWLELPVHPFRSDLRLSLIPHRTITHWLLPWLLGCWLLWPSMLAGDPFGSACAGFCIGGISHIALDFLTPLGVPVLVPWSRWHL